MLLLLGLFLLAVTGSVTFFHLFLFAMARLVRHHRNNLRKNLIPILFMFNFKSWSDEILSQIVAVATELLRRVRSAQNLAITRLILVFQSLFVTFMEQIPNKFCFYLCLHKTHIIQHIPMSDSCHHFAFYSFIIKEILRLSRIIYFFQAKKICPKK